MPRCMSLYRLICCSIRLVYCFVYITPWNTWDIHPSYNRINNCSISPVSCKVNCNINFCILGSGASSVTLNLTGAVRAYALFNQLPWIVPVIAPLVVFKSPFCLRCCIFLGHSKLSYALHYQLHYL